jgi:hypothetical protein
MGMRKRLTKPSFEVSRERQNQPRPKRGYESAISVTVAAAGAEERALEAEDSAKQLDLEGAMWKLTARCSESGFHYTESFPIGVPPSEEQYVYFLARLQHAYADHRLAFARSYSPSQTATSDWPAPSERDEAQAPPRNRARQ